MTQTQHPTKTKILDAALHVIRSKGYTATTVDDICASSGITKGGFFHHFGGKEELAIAAAGHFGAMADGLFAQAPYQNIKDPLFRLLGYVDFRISILKGALPQYTCLLGTMVQEVYETHPAIREACDQCITHHAMEVAKDIALAKDYYAPHATWSAESLGLYMQSVLQGSFILAKARSGPQIAIECLQHLRRYLELLFEVPTPEEQMP
jgi:TetR/AcrR family transcriptional regulator, transcriptional repressor for nem operon